MPDKTRTVVVIESHEQTIIRRSRRVISSQVALPVERPVEKYHTWMAGWWRTVVLKAATVFAPLPRRLKPGANTKKGRP